VQRMAAADHDGRATVPWLNGRVIVTSVVGARPQFVKLAPVHAALVAAGHRHRIVHTGQHYDHDMSDQFFEEFGIPRPDANLGVGSSSHARQTASMMVGIEEVLAAEPPDWVLVYGDTNSTLAAALVAAKLLLPLAHLEAGLRSFNPDMPEEQNRIVADHLGDLLLAPTDNAMSHLAREGLAGRAVMVGDVMADVCLSARDQVRAAGEVPGGAPYLLATVHRQENTDDPARLRALVDLLGRAPLPVRLHAHPRLTAKFAQAGVTNVPANVSVLPPLGYRALVAAVLGSAGVVTDSGGLQKEAYLLERPCLTLRHETEWPETLEGGWNRLLGDGASFPPGFPDATLSAAGRGEPYGDGRAAHRVVGALAASRRRARG